MTTRPALVLAAVASAAIAAWPFFLAKHSVAVASIATPAPVIADYLYRDRLVASSERNAQRNPDQITTRMLASQYLLRYRETGDVGDLLRAEHAAETSLRIQPRFNIGGQMTMASAESSLHRFREALWHAHEAMLIEPWNTSAIAQAASIETELGRYDDAAKLLRSARPGPVLDVNLYTALARYDEITGSLDAARRYIDLAMQQSDAVIDNPAEARAWYHFRAGELAWSEGDTQIAETRYREALQIFPNYARAYNGLARLYWGQRRWNDALAAASRAADLLPLPETLGYKADAQSALGDKKGAQETQDLIFTLERIGNAKGLNDRALAIYYSEHGVRLDHAVRIARRDVSLRDDVFAEDTLAWALAQGGHWNEAAAEERKALKLSTQDARLQFHAGVIALHQGDRDEAERRLRFALELNTQFHPYYAPEANRLLAQIRADAR